MRVSKKERDTERERIEVPALKADWGTGVGVEGGKLGTLVVESTQR